MNCQIQYVFAKVWNIDIIKQIIYAIIYCSLLDLQSRGRRTTATWATSFSSTGGSNNCTCYHCDTTEHYTRVSLIAFITLHVKLSFRLFIQLIIFCCVLPLFLVIINCAMDAVRHLNDEFF